MRNKKAMELFHWILIMIVGAVILLFAIIFAGKSGGVEQQKQNVLVAEYLELFFNPFASVGSVAESFGKKVSLPFEIEAELRCQDGKEILLVGSGEKVSSEKVENFVFSKQRFKAKELFVFTKSFESPFRVADLIFLFDSGQKYCLLYDEGDFESEDLISEFKDDIAGSLVDSERNFVYCQDLRCCNEAGSSKIISLNAQKGDVNIVPLGEVGEKYSYGEVRFNQGQERKSVFIGPALIEAAIFSDYSLYSCNLRRLMEKTGKISDIYSEKASYLASIPQQQVCNYNSLKQDLQNIKVQATNLGTGQSSSSARALFSAAEEFADKNRVLPCVQIY